MKKLIIILLFGIFVFPIATQAQVITDQQKSLYQNKVYKFTKMKSAGIGLTIGGSILTLSGFIMMVEGASRGSRYDYLSSDSNYCGSDLPASFYLGVLGTTLGISATAGGIVLWSIGGAKVRSYSKKLNPVSLNLNPSPNQMLSLSYRF